MKGSISILTILSLIFISSCTQVSFEESTEGALEESMEKNIAMEQELCKSQGGYWNECGSPCLGTDAEYCIEVCEEHCECGGIAGFNCPGGYRCRLTGKIADELGVCIKE